MITSKKIEIKTPGEWTEIPFDLERPFLKVVDCYASSKTEFESNFQFNLTLETVFANGAVATNPRGINASKKHNSFQFSSFVVDLEGAKLLRVKFDLDSNKGDVESVFFEFEPMQYLEMKFPVGRFDAHIQNPKNTKILFSAPYGQGKSTFLDVYFKTKANEYNVFRVFPVNYSVASNEDIFRYIKSDILCQLLLKGVEFDLNKITYSDAFLRHVKDNPVKVFAPFLQSIPKIGKQIYDVFELVRKNVRQDDKTDAAKFVKDVYEQEGGVFEDNFFTQLTRQLLSKYHENHGGENVLIIDDLDRMDPAHIFRMLNVISAHYDTYRLLDDQEHNKFGFDKIIIVCDLENVRYIFQHRYGTKTDFIGYINKFYSTEKFDFNNKEEYLNLIRSFKQHSYVSPEYQTVFNCFEFVSRCLIESNQLSLREILKMQTFPFWDQLKNVQLELQNRDSPYFARCAFTPVLFLYSKLGSIDSMVQRFEKCIKYEFEFGKGAWNDLTKLAIIGAADRRSDNKLTYRVSDGEIGISVDLDTIYFNKGMEFTPFDTLKLTSFNKSFSQEDFFEILIQNARRLEQLL